MKVNQVDDNYKYATSGAMETRWPKNTNRGSATPTYSVNADGSARILCPASSTLYLVEFQNHLEFSDEEWPAWKDILVKMEFTAEVGQTTIDINDHFYVIVGFKANCPDDEDAPYVGIIYYHDGTDNFGQIRINVGYLDADGMSSAGIETSDYENHWWYDYGYVRQFTDKFIANLHYVDSSGGVVEVSGDGQEFGSYDTWSDYSPPIDGEVDLAKDALLYKFKDDGIRPFILINTYNEGPVYIDLFKVTID